MADQSDLETLGREIVDTNLYVTLATADEAGRPWASPVYFAPAGYGELLWVSKPGTRHSRNLAVRPEVGLVIFDSTVPISTGRAVYMSAVAVEVPPGDVDRDVEIFSRSAVARGGSPWQGTDVLPPARHRLYRATVSEQWVLDEHDERIPVRL